MTATPPDHPARPGGMLTAADLAERWQVPVSHVYNLAQTGAVPVVKLGRYRRFRLEAIEDFEAASGTR